MELVAGTVSSTQKDQLDFMISRSQTRTEVLLDQTGKFLIQANVVENQQLFHGMKLILAQTDHYIVLIIYIELLYY